MALEWKVDQIRNYMTVCWIGEGDERRMNPVTHALIFNAMAIDMGEITADNAAEVYARTRIMEAINGTLLQKGGESVAITFDDIQAHIGLWCNVSYKSRLDWAKRWFVGHGDYLVRYGTKRKRPEEIERIEDGLDGIDVSQTESHAREYRAHIKRQVMETVQADPVLRDLT